MESLITYKGSDSESDEEIKQSITNRIKHVNSKPMVATPFDNPSAINSMTTTGIAGSDSNVKSYKKTVTGILEPTFIEGYAFDEQHATFQKMGYAHDPSGKHRYIGDVEGASRSGGATVKVIKSSNEEIRALKKRKLHGGFASDVHGFRGPWAPSVGEEEWRKTALERGIMTDEQKAAREEWLAKQKKTEEDKAEREKEKSAGGGRSTSYGDGEEPEAPAATAVADTQSTFHGDSMSDYLGRSWNTPPSTVHDDDGDHTCFVPKKLEHKWLGHSKGVQSIRFAPKFGHLLLSGSADTKVKIWDVYNKRQCMRTYMGHSAGIKEVNFNVKGDQFLSCSFDKTVKLWDVESGVCKASFTNHKLLFCATFYPKDDNIFLSGCNNKMVVQFDVRVGNTIVQEYNHHLGPVNTVTFFDEDRRFASTSDDKKLLLWEFNIPVPIKYLSDPSMHSMPAVTINREGVFAGQSMDNTIVCYDAKSNFKTLHKKVFKGHSNAGYACQVGFSTDSRFLFSGDGEGKLWFWDYKNGRVIRKMKAHDKGPTIGAIWHPLEPSKVATCGWDGVIKLWD